MRSLKLTAAVLVASLAFVPVAKAQAFILGMVAGGALFGGDSVHGSNGASVLYSADEKLLKGVDAMTIRLVSKDACFDSSYNPDHSNKSLGELFAGLMKRAGKKDGQQTVLQIVRAFDPSKAPCAAIWFAYVDKPQ